MRGDYACNRVMPAGSANSGATPKTGTSKDNTITIQR